MINYTLSRASLADVPELEALLNSAFRGESSKQGWTHEADLIIGERRTDEETLQGLIQNPEALMLALRLEDASLVGCVALEKKGNLLYLGMLSVAPHLQGHGIGKILLAAAEEQAREQGIGAIEMTVISVRTELIDWYIRHGYRPTGETRPFVVPQKYGSPVEQLVFTVLEKQI